MEYIFKTTATMKEYNRKYWWIDAGIITEKRIIADTLNDALRLYAEQVEEKHYISISKNALKEKRGMYVDTVSDRAKQISYVITGKADFQKDNYKWVQQYVDLWVEILTVSTPDFPETDF